MAQTHASQHTVAEHLCERYVPPGATAPPVPPIRCPDGVQVAEAHGTARVPNLVAVLTAAAASPDDRITALHALGTLLPIQECKSQALAAGAPAALVALLPGTGRGAPSQAGDSQLEQRQRQLACGALAQLAQLRSGRAAISAAAGLQALCTALASAPGPAAAAFRAFAGGADGVSTLRASPARVTFALSEALEHPATPLAAAADAAAVLGAMAGTNGGVVEACGAQVPAAMVMLLQRALRFKLGAQPGGGGGGGGGCCCGSSGSGAVLQSVAGEAMTCLRALCNHADGKAQVRLAGGIQVLARVLVAPGAGPELQRLAVSTLASLAVDADAKVAVIAHAGSALVASLRGGDPEAAGCAAAALRLAVEDLDARRKFEGIITPGEAVALLGRLPDTPPCYRLA